MKRINRWNLSVLAFLVAGLTAVLAPMHGCADPGRLTGDLHATPDRSRRLMLLAAEEAAAIPDVDARLTRQLNLADLQIQRAWREDARTTLAAARATLSSEDARALNDHARLGGWVSVSELCRAIEDSAGATAACERAVQALHEIEDPAVRCEFVMGVANELQYLKGKDAAARQLAAAGPWTQSIDDVARRRRAVVSFASALFNLDDFAAGQQVLRSESDPAWRSDTLTRLASMPTPRKYAGSSSAAPMALESTADQRPAPAGDELYFGKSLRYRDVFRGQQRSQTKE